MDPTIGALINSAIDLAGKLAWPILVGVIALRYEGDIRALLPRLRRAGKDGVELDPAQQQKIAVDPAKTEQKLNMLPPLATSPAIDGEAQEVRAHIATIEDGDQRTAFLVTQLAMNRLMARFGYIYALIYGSQIEGLARLNERVSTPLPDAQAFFEQYRLLNPAAYEGYGFEGWLGFLLRFKLVAVANGSVSITEVGRDFLLYLTAMRLTDLKPL